MRGKTPVTRKFLLWAANVRVLETVLVELYRISEPIRHDKTLRVKEVLQKILG